MLKILRLYYGVMMYLACKSAGYEWGVAVSQGFQNSYLIFALWLSGSILATLKPTFVPRLICGVGSIAFYLYLDRLAWHQPQMLIFIVMALVALLAPFGKEGVFAQAWRYCGWLAIVCFLGDKSWPTIAIAIIAMSICLKHFGYLRSRHAGLVLMGILAVEFFAFNSSESVLPFLIVPLFFTEPSTEGMLALKSKPHAGQTTTA